MRDEFPALMENKCDFFFIVTVQVIQLSFGYVTLAHTVFMTMSPLKVIFVKLDN